MPKSSIATLRAIGAKGADFVEHRSAHVHCCAFGEFQFDHRKRNIGICQGLAQLYEEVWPLKLTRTDVEADPARKAVSLPGRERGRDFRNYPFADVGDDSGPFSNRDEARRHAQALARVIPANECLCAAQLAGDEAHLGLECEHELVALKRLRQRPLGLHPFLVLGSEARVEKGELTATQGFRAIHRNISGAHERFDTCAMVGRNRDSDRRSNIDRMGRDLERLRGRKDDAARNSLGIFLGCDVREEQGELVASKPCDERTRASCLRRFGIDDHA